MGASLPAAVASSSQYPSERCEHYALVDFNIFDNASQWIDLTCATAGKLLRSLRDKAEQWWYFLDRPQVPPDNNLAERSLRLTVTKLKVSGGSRKGGVISTHC